MIVHPNHVGVHVTVCVYCTIFSFVYIFISISFFLSLVVALYSLFNISPQIICIVSCKSECSYLYLRLF